MAFEIFDKVRGGKTNSSSSSKNGESLGRRSPWVQFVRTGDPSKPGYMLLFGIVALEEFGLAVGDRIRLGFDPETGQVGFKKDDPDSEQGLILGRHGKSEKRLRASVTKFFRKHPELVTLNFPYKVDARRQRGRGGWIVFDTRENGVVRRGPGRPRKVEQPVVEGTVRRGPGRPRKVEEPVVENVVKRGPGRPRKVEQPVVEGTIRRGPGRPRKVEQPVVEGTIRRGPGRPRKVEEPVVENVVKRGPGRPRKEPVLA